MSVCHSVLQCFCRQNNKYIALLHTVCCHELIFFFSLGNSRAFSDQIAWGAVLWYSIALSQNLNVINQYLWFYHSIVPKVWYMVFLSSVLCCKWMIFKRSFGWFQNVMIVNKSAGSRKSVWNVRTVEASWEVSISACVCVACVCGVCVCARARTRVWKDMSPLSTPYTNRSDDLKYDFGFSFFFTV